MKLSKRIRHIATATVQDFYNSGKSSTESKEETIEWLVTEMLKVEQIGDFYTYEISILMLKMLGSLDIVDEVFIEEVLR